MKRIVVFVFALLFLLIIPGCEKNKNKDMLVGQWSQKNASVMSGPSSLGDNWTSVDFYVYEFDEDSSFYYIHYTADNCIGFWTIRTNEVTGNYLIKNGIVTLKCSHEAVITRLLDGGGILNENQNDKEWEDTLEYYIDSVTNELILEPDSSGHSKYNHNSVPEDTETLWLTAVQKLP